MDNIWGENTGQLEQSVEISTARLDTLVTELREATKDYDVHKQVASDKYKRVSELECQLIELMIAANKSAYIVEGLGKVTLVPKASVKTPKTFDDKKKLFEWIRHNRGEDALLALQSIHSATLNSFYNAEVKNAIENQIEFDGIDGLEEPSVTTTLQFRSIK